LVDIAKGVWVDSREEIERSIKGGETEEIIKRIAGLLEEMGVK